MDKEIARTKVRFNADYDGQESSVVWLSVAAARRRVAPR